MEVYDRLKLLTSQMHLEPTEDTICPPVTSRHQDKISVSDAALPNGKTITLLKSQLSSVCERNCNYCPFRAGRDFERATFKPEEFAKIFMALYHARLAEGIFLSSGIVNNGIFTQDKLIDTAHILRYKLGFRGYIHLKIMPGAEFDQVERVMQLADRVSINLEAPNEKHLKELAPRKFFTTELLDPLKWINQIRKTKPSHKGWNGKWPTSVTQFVVSAVGESDLELLVTTEYLYRQLQLKRTYYSSFNPISDTPLENIPPGSLVRQHRLYEASFLLRDYGFNLEDLPFNQQGQLPLDVDPKYAWAKENLTNQPIEINHADKNLLLRIPGIGPKSVNSILQTRINNQITNLAELRGLGVNTKRAAPFIVINGKLPVYQSSFF